jgi:hypothetical protein
VTGFPPGVVITGTIHAADAVAAQAQADLTTAYDDAAGRAPTASIAGDLGGLTLLPGVYKASSSIGLTGTVTLDAQGDPNAVFVFQIGSTLTTASASVVSLINSAAACNVFWQVGSSATLGTGSTMSGSILALTSITATTDVTVDGRLLARNGAVTLDANAITDSTCAPPEETTTTTTTTTTAAVGPTTTVAPQTTTPDSSTTTAVSTTVAETPTTLSGGSTTTTSPGGATTFLARTGTPLNVLVAAGLFILLLGGAIIQIAKTRRLQRS